MDLSSQSDFLPIWRVVQGRVWPPGAATVVDVQALDGPTAIHASRLQGTVRVWRCGSAQVPDCYHVARMVSGYYWGEHDRQR